MYSGMRFLCCWLYRSSVSRRANALGSCRLAPPPTGLAPAAGRRKAAPAFRPNPCRHARPPGRRLAPAPVYPRCIESRAGRRCLESRMPDKPRIRDNVVSIVESALDTPGTQRRNSVGETVDHVLCGWGALRRSRRLASRQPICIAPSQSAAFPRRRVCRFAFASDCGRRPSLWDGDGCEVGLRRCEVR